MREISASWEVDDLGPEKVVFARLVDGVEAYVVVDNLARGPAIGGVRLTPTVGVGEVARLARAMTLKNALAGIPYGGAKAGIVAPAGLDGHGRERLIRSFAAAIARLTEYIPGPDMGTDESCMAYVHDEIGRCVGLPAELGGIPLDELGATGFGVAVCADTLAAAKRVELDGARVVVQGFGAVGRHAALALAERGARVIAVSDSGGAVADPDGLDLAALIEATNGASVADVPGFRRVERDAILWQPCDILVPAAQPDVFTKANAGAVRAKVILQGANIPATPAAEEEFHRRGILSIPDVVANAGGVICGAAEYRGAGRRAAFAEIEERITDTTGELLDRLARRDDLPRAAAVEMATSRLRTAASYRRRF